MSFNHLFNGVDLKTANNAMLDDLGAIANKAKEQAVSDIDKKALDHAIFDMRSKALAVVLGLADSILDGNLDDDETPSERLEALLSQFDLDDDDDNIVASILYANMKDAAESLGVAEAMADDAFLSDDPLVQDEAIEAMADIINSNVPDDDEFDEWREQFIYGDDDDDDFDDEAEQYDSILKGRADKAGNFSRTIKSKKSKNKGQTFKYKAVKAIRNGRLTLVAKRISGNFKLTQGQENALKAARSKAHSTTANQKRLKSLIQGVRQKVYKNNDFTKKMIGGMYKNRNQETKKKRK